MARDHTRNISLTPELDRYVEAQLSSGAYSSASEVVREGLRLHEREEQRRLLGKWLTEGLTAEEEARLPADLLDRAKEHFNGLIEEGLRDAQAGRVACRS